MLTSHQWGLVSFIWEHIHIRYHDIWLWYGFQIYSCTSSGPISWISSARFANIIQISQQVETNITTFRYAINNANTPCIKILRNTRWTLHSQYTIKLPIYTSFPCSLCLILRVKFYNTFATLRVIPQCKMTPLASVACFVHIQYMSGTTAPVSMYMQRFSMWFIGI